MDKGTTLRSARLRSELPTCPQPLLRRRRLGGSLFNRQMVPFSIVKVQAN